MIVMVYAVLCGMLALFGLSEVVVCACLDGEESVHAINTLLNMLLMSKKVFLCLIAMGVSADNASMKRSRCLAIAYIVLQAFCVIPVTVWLLQSRGVEMPCYESSLDLLLGVGIELSAASLMWCLMFDFFRTRRFPEACVGLLGSFLMCLVCPILELLVIVLPGYMSHIAYLACRGVGFGSTTLLSCAFLISFLSGRKLNVENLTWIGGCISCLARWSDFNGKTTRAEYWRYMCVLIVLFLGALGGDIFCLETVFFVFAVGGIHLLPMVAATCRRLSDSGMSPWLILLCVSNPMGIIVLALLLMRRSVQDKLILRHGVTMQHNAVS